MYRLTDEIAVVNTVDFFTPVVDDPFTYGQISAANSLSDMYAMGGVPKTALNLVCWPQSGLPGEMLGEILRGGAEKAREAGVVIVGGHSVADEEVKYGMAMTGSDRSAAYRAQCRRARRRRPAAHQAARHRRPDDRVQTRPLAAEHYEAAVRSMTALNAEAARAMLRHQVHAATDITGFGVVGHASKMADGSGVTLRIEESDLPLLPARWICCREGMIPGGGGATANSMGRESKSPTKWRPRWRKSFSIRKPRAAC